MLFNLNMRHSLPLFSPLHIRPILLSLKMTMTTTGPAVGQFELRDCRFESGDDRD
jgi:hypothetical protein